MAETLYDLPPLAQPAPAPTQTAPAPSRTAPAPAEPAPAPFDEQAWQELLVDAASQVREREDEHRLPRELLTRVLDLGLGRARVPVAQGGLGWSLRTTIERLIELAAADSHLAHVFRGHLVLLEEVALFAEPAVREEWFARAVAGDFIGNAQSEQGAALEITTTLRRDGDRYLLSGTKYYTTGSIYADWIDLVATTEDGEIALATISTHQDGVICVDDWDGFGQQLTGTGTTRFVDAEVTLRDVRGSERSTAQGQLRQGLFQLVLLAVLAGIGQASVDAAVTYVQGRRRLFGRFGETEVREDPIVQDVLGGAASGAFAARTLVTAVAETWDRLIEEHRLGLATEEDFREGKRDVFRIQGEVVDRVLALTTEIFEVGGASQVTARHGFDRFWRHARTVASHNPARQRRRLIGAHELGVEASAEQFGDHSPSSTPAPSTPAPSSPASPSPTA